MRSVRLALPALLAIALNVQAGPCPVALQASRVLDVGVGSDPVATILVDVDRDGAVDLVLARAGARDVAVLRGYGSRSGRFEPPDAYPMVGIPEDLAVGDLNGDGAPDAVLAEGGFQIMMNDGAGSFVTGVPISAGVGAAVQIADVNGDGDMDVVGVGAAGLGVLRGNGDGTFQPATYAATGYRPRDLALGDLDGDGFLDAVVANPNANDVSVFRGSGTGAFAMAGRYPAGADPDAVAVADLNGDGALDVVAADLSGDAAVVLLGTGTGALGPAVAYAVGSSPSDVLVVDVDGDGIADLVLSTAYSIDVLVGLGNGTFAPAIDALRPSGEVAAGDVDQDGSLDFAAASGSVLVLHHGNGDGTFGAPRYPSLAPTYSVAAGDYDADGAQDLAFGADPWVLGVRLGNGDGTFGPVAWLSVTRPLEHLAAADLDGDGTLDLVATSQFGTLNVLLGNGDGTFRIGSEYGSGSNSQPPRIADLNRDGAADVVLANYYFDNDVSVFLGNGDGTFRPRVAYAVGNEPRDVTAADMDGDGDLDLVAANFGGSGSVTILFGFGNGTFGSPLTFAAPPDLTSVAAGDANGDGLVDVVTAGIRYGQPLAILLGRPGGALAPPAPLFLPVTLRDVRLVDLNLDGALDLLALSVGGSFLFVLAGNGDGTFAPWEGYEAGWWVAGEQARPDVGDWDGDGRPDLAVPGEASQEITVVLDTTQVCSPVSAFLVGQGHGAPSANRLRVFDAAAGATSVDFLAYTAGAWGVNAAAGDLDADARDEILAGPGPGPTLGPHVRGFTRGGAALGKVSFYAYGTLQFGVDISGSDVDGDGFGEILTGAGPGAVFGPHVRGFDYDAVRVAPIAGLSYYAYGTLKFGVRIGGGNVDGDAFDEILTGPGPGPAFAPSVRGWQHDGAGIAPMTKIAFNAYGYRHGVRVCGGDVDGDGFDEIATVPGPDPLAPPHVRGFDYDALAITVLPGYEDVVLSTGFGGTAGVGDLAGDGREELVVGPGPDPAAAASVRELLYEGSALVLHPATPFLAFPSSYGVEAAAGALR